jgi:uncharacterized protein YbjT (DUF2867 family)
MEPRRLFIAGSTGATGRAVVRLADARGAAIVPHMRPRTATSASATTPTDPRAAVVDLADRAKLAGAMQGCTTVLQLIGTIRSRFSAGDTYESSDVGTTRQLVEAAVDARVDHIVLLGSIGAGHPVGAYLRAKARAERIVRESGIAWTILRPSAFQGDRHAPPQAFGAFTRALGLHALQPIALDDVAAALLQVGVDRAPLDRVLVGREIEALAARWNAGAVTG